MLGSVARYLPSKSVQESIKILIFLMISKTSYFCKSCLFSELLAEYQCTMCVMTLSPLKFLALNLERLLYLTEAQSRISKVWEDKESVSWSFTSFYSLLPLLALDGSYVKITLIAQPFYGARVHSRKVTVFFKVSWAAACLSICSARWGKWTSGMTTSLVPGQTSLSRLAPLLTGVAFASCVLTFCTWKRGKSFVENCICLHSILKELTDKEGDQSGFGARPWTLPPQPMVLKCPGRNDL